MHVKVGEAILCFHSKYYNVKPVRKNIPNVVLYAESGCMRLKAIIYNRQLEFYRKMKADATNDPH